MPYFEQIPEKQDAQVTHNKCFALTKANKERMDLVEIWWRRQGIGSYGIGNSRVRASGECSYFHLAPVEANYMQNPARIPPRNEDGVEGSRFGALRLWIDLNDLCEKH
jgi:hypothetical protein